MGRRHPVSQEAGYSSSVLVVTLAYGQRNALTRRDDAARPAVAPFCRNGARLTRRDDAARRPGGTGAFQSVGAAEGQPLPLSRFLHSPGRLSLFYWRMPGLLINALAGVCGNGGQVQLAPAVRAGWKLLGSFSFLSVNFVSDRTFRSLCLSSVVIHMQRIALAWCFPVNDERGIP